MKTGERWRGPTRPSETYLQFRDGQISTCMKLPGECYRFWRGYNTHKIKKHYFETNSSAEGIFHSTTIAAALPNALCVLAERLPPRQAKISLVEPPRLGNYEVSLDDSAFREAFLVVAK